MQALEPIADPGRYRLEDLPERIRSKIKVNPVTGCWEYQAAPNGKRGYMRVLWQGRPVLVHRLVYTLLAGPIPVDLRDLDHVKARGCRSTACCWPAHLEPVTQAENIRRRGPGRSANGAKTHCPAGHEYTPENTYLRPPAGHRACRREKDRRRKHEAAAREGRTIAARPAARTRCLRGHEFTPENTYTRKNGTRMCRTCKRMRDRERTA
jgi:hypothetical protein